MPRRWFAAWVRDEGFWRDVTTRTISALIAGAIALLAARTAGLISQIPWSTIGKTLASGGLWLSLASLGVSLTFTLNDYRAHKNRMRQHELAQQIREDDSGNEDKQ